MLPAAQRVVSQRAAFHSGPVQHALSSSSFPDRKMYKMCISARNLFGSSPVQVGPRSRQSGRLCSATARSLVPGLDEHGNKARMSTTGFSSFTVLSTFWTLHVKGRQNHVLLKSKFFKQGSWITAAQPHSVVFRVFWKLEQKSGLSPASCPCNYVYSCLKYPSVQKADWILLPPAWLPALQASHREMDDWKTSWSSSTE